MGSPLRWISSPCRPATGMSSTTAGCSATCARAPASYVTASGACASCGSARATGSCSPATGAPAASAWIPWRRSRSTTSCPVRRSSLRHRRLQPGLPVLPELGHLQVQGDRHAGRRRLSGGHRPGGDGRRMPQRGVHLQRPDHLPRVRQRRGRRLPRARPQDGGGDRRLHLPGTTGRLLRSPRRRQRRPQGVHRGLLPPPVRRASWTPCSTASSISTRRPTCGSS